MVKSYHLSRPSCKSHARLGSLVPHKHLSRQLADEALHLQAEQGHRHGRCRHSALSTFQPQL
jgi:hypothetical protein